MELEGVEPSSKQAAKRLSTCLSPGWLSGSDRSGENQSDPYSLFSHPGSGNLPEPSQLFRCLGRNTAEKGFPGDKWCLISKIKQPICKNNRRHLLAVRIGFYGTCSQRPACLHIRFLAVKTDQPHVDCKDTQKSTHVRNNEFTNPEISFFPFRIL